MSGAYSKPMPWSGGGSTKPPVANNYLDSHGLNAGLGNAGAAKFPSVVESRPIQVAIVFTQRPFKIWLFKYNSILGCEDGELHQVTLADILHPTSEIIIHPNNSHSISYK